MAQKGRTEPFDAVTMTDRSWHEYVMCPAMLNGRLPLWRSSSRGWAVALPRTICSGSLNIVERPRPRLVQRRILTLQSCDLHPVQGCAAIFNALTVPPQAGFRICAKSLLGINPANCRVASSDRLALAHGSLALRVSANLSDHSLSTAVLALLTRSCPSRRLRRTAEMGGGRTSGRKGNRVISIR